MTAPAEAARGGDAVRAALVVAAAEMLGEMGPRALSVREVARRAGVNHGQVHHYFGGKRALLVAAMKHLALGHAERARELSGGGAIPPPLSLAESPSYWRAICQVVMDGDLDLARTEIDEGVSVPRRALRAFQAEHGLSARDLDFKARFAAIVTLQLGWVAFEDFVRLLADVGESDRAELRERMKGIVVELAGRDSPWTSD